MSKPESKYPQQLAIIKVCSQINRNPGEFARSQRRIKISDGNNKFVQEKQQVIDF
ncbi:hypothetical protein [Nostoc linckia]|uniref:hypothetical protein n=1 Tax=Nostoc linckia TaxID=92942 RepID=UPI0015D52203|nr:hypothetical protein [Nostoc linckia]